MSAQPSVNDMGRVGVDRNAADVRNPASDVERARALYFRDGFSPFDNV